MVPFWLGRRVLGRTLCAKQIEALQHPLTLTFEVVSKVSKRWHHRASIEEKFFKQKPCIKWLISRDQNTSFFHKVTQGRALKNAIKHLQNDYGETLTEMANLKKKQLGTTKFFSKVNLWFTRSSRLLLTTAIQGQRLMLLFGQQMHNRLIQFFFSVSGDKEPRSDGYPGELYKAVRSIVGRNFVIAVFFVNGFMPKIINATILSLAQKHAYGKQMSDYWSIACCNILYKVISKIIAKWLKETLPRAIYLNHCSFVKLTWVRFYSRIQ